MAFVQLRENGSVESHFSGQPAPGLPQTVSGDGETVIDVAGGQGNYDSASAVAVQADGRVVAAGYSDGNNIAMTFLRLR